MLTVDNWDTYGMCHTCCKWPCQCQYLTFTYPPVDLSPVPDLCEDCGMKIDYQPFYNKSVTKCIDCYLRCKTCKGSVKDGKDCHGRCKRCIKAKKELLND